MLQMQLDMASLDMLLTQLDMASLDMLRMQLDMASLDLLQTQLGMALLDMFAMQTRIEKACFRSKTRFFVKICLHILRFNEGIDQLKGSFCRLL